MTKKKRAEKQRQLIWVAVGIVVVAVLAGLVGYGQGIRTYIAGQADTGGELWISAEQGGSPFGESFFDKEGDDGVGVADGGRYEIQERTKGIAGVKTNSPPILVQAGITKYPKATGKNPKITYTFTTEPADEETIKKLYPNNGGIYTPGNVGKVGTTTSVNSVSPDATLHSGSTHVWTNVNTSKPPVYKVFVNADKKLEEHQVVKFKAKFEGEDVARYAVNGKQSDILGVVIVQGYLTIKNDDGELVPLPDDLFD